jgi:phosphotransferase system HPr (HPr) family protein
MIRKQFELMNKSGLHARPASKLCAMARGFFCDVQVNFNDQIIDAKKILDLMAANLKPGAKFLVVCDGPDEGLAMDLITEFIKNLDE